MFLFKINAADSFFSCELQSISYEMIMLLQELEPSQVHLPINKRKHN